VTSGGGAQGVIVIQYVPFVRTNHSYAFGI
jgi:hypothetical protein